MWIRSQNKKKLITVNQIEVIRNGTIHGYASFTSEDLGTYSTEEKALKVLDKIEEWIRYECCGVFQMPQDDAVEV